MGGLRRACWVIGCSALLLSCARHRSSAPGASGEPHERAAGPRPSAAASGDAPEVPTGEAAGFPLVGAEFSALVPAEVGFGDAGRLLLIAEADAALVGGSLPFIASIARRAPALRVLVVDRSDDARLRSWLLAQRFVPVEPTPALSKFLEEFERKSPFALALAHQSSPWPSMAASDGVAYGEPEQVYLFHDRRLVWVGSGPNVRFVVDSVMRGDWTIERLKEYESVRGEVDRYGALALKGDYDGARRVAEAVLARPNAQPARLVDLAQAMGAGLDSKAHVELLLSLARKADLETAGLDEGILMSAALAHSLAGDSRGAASYGRRALALCRSMKSNCDGQERAAERHAKCPLVLVETPAILRKQGTTPYPRYQIDLAPNAPPDCR